MSILTEKPWGYEDLIENNNRYVVKKLFMKKGYRCSLQYHNKKKETIYILEGKLRILNEAKDGSFSSDHDYVPGQHITIEPGNTHRMTAIEDSLYLEASTPELDDVVRVEDDYGR